MCSASLNGPRDFGKQELLIDYWLKSMLFYELNRLNHYGVKGGISLVPKSLKNERKTSNMQMTACRDLFPLESKPQNVPFSPVDFSQQ